MNNQTMTLDQVRRAGLDALARELGPVGMVRFLQQFETGVGDYSAERHALIGSENVALLGERIRQARPQGNLSNGGPESESIAPRLSSPEPPGCD